MNLLLIGLGSCTLDENYIEKTYWKHCGERPVLHDFIRFNDGALRNDTIYGKTVQKEDSAIAVIVKTEKRWKADNIIYIKLLSDGSIGRYCDKGQWK